jgi:transcription termination/antitermination protein NusA
MMNLVETFSEFKSGKNIDRPTMVRVLEDVFRTLIKKKFGSDENFDVIVNTQKGDLELWRVREIVPDGEVLDDRSQVSIPGRLWKTVYHGSASDVDFPNHGIGERRSL